MRIAQIPSDGARSDAIVERRRLRALTLREDISEEASRLDPGGHSLPDKSRITRLPAGVVAKDDRETARAKRQGLASQKRVDACDLGYLGERHGIACSC